MIRGDLERSGEAAVGLLPSSHKITRIENAIVLGITIAPSFSYLHNRSGRHNNSWASAPTYQPSSSSYQPFF